MVIDIHMMIEYQHKDGQHGARLPSWTKRTF